MRGAEDTLPLLGDDGVTLYDGIRLPDPVPGDPPYIWSLHALAIEATNAAWRGKPAAIIWHFQLSAEPTFGHRRFRCSSPDGIRGCL
jgi:hypothetical protein